ncbi:hypothetical protein C8F01DRAFT_1257412 [Mycena amicta]|nr:hypothetical protein C8F01DRAFT_1257412 [Mycena amicta]
MDEIRKRYMLTRQYLASPHAVAAHAWKRRASGETLCIKDNDGKYNISVITVIGKVSDAGLLVDGLGGWKATYADTPMEKAKYQMQLERPEGTPFATDWDIAIGHAVKVQKLIQKTPEARNLDHRRQSQRAFCRTSFALTTIAGYDTDKWTVPEEYEMKFFETGQNFRFTPVLVNDKNGSRVGCEFITEALQGSFVECHFSVRHYRVKDHNGVWYDSFTGDIEEVCILDHAPLMKKIKHLNWRDILANASPSTPPAVHARGPPIAPTPRANTPAGIPETPTGTSPMVDVQTPGPGPSALHRNIPVTPTPRTRHGRGPAGRRPQDRVIASGGTSNLTQMAIAQSSPSPVALTSGLATPTFPPNSLFRAVAVPSVLNNAEDDPQTPPSFSGSSVSLTPSDLASMVASQDRAVRQTPGLFSGPQYDWTSSPTMLIGGFRQPLQAGLHTATFDNGDAWSDGPQPLRLAGVDFQRNEGPSNANMHATQDTHMEDNESDLTDYDMVSAVPQKRAPSRAATGRPRRTTRRVTGPA